jgi:murein L,D-transpeptidase YcbB/YkuD
MEKLKFILFSVIVLFLLGIVGYWSVTTIQSGSEFVATQKIAQLQKENDDLTNQVLDLTDKLNIAQSQVEPAASAPVSQASTQAPAPTTPISTTNTTKKTTYKNQGLINELQKLVTANVSIKLNSTGTEIGIVQNFLNVYNSTSNKIDNDYGASTVKAVAAFQKAMGMTADGQAGVSTFNKMISWLKKQG